MENPTHKVDQLLDELDSSRKYCIQLQNQLTQAYERESELEKQLNLYREKYGPLETNDNNNVNNNNNNKNSDNIDENSIDNNAKKIESGENENEEIDNVLNLLSDNVVEYCTADNESLEIASQIQIKIDEPESNSIDKPNENSSRKLILDNRHSRMVMKAESLENLTLLAAHNATVDNLDLYCLLETNLAAVCVEHEPSLVSRAWWQPKASRKDVDTQLVKAFEHLKCAFGQQSDEIDLWQYDILADSLPRVIVRESSSNKGLLALATLDNGRVRHALVQPLWQGPLLIGFYCQTTSTEFTFKRTLAQLVDEVMDGTSLEIKVHSSLNEMLPIPLPAELTLHVTRLQTLNDLKLQLENILFSKIPILAKAFRFDLFIKLFDNKEMLIVLRDSMSTFLKASENHSETNKIFEPIIVALYTHNLWIPFCDILLKDSSNGVWISCGEERPGGALVAACLRIQAQMAGSGWVTKRLKSAIESSGVQNASKTDKNAIDASLFSLAATLLAAFARRSSDVPTRVSSMAAKLRKHRATGDDDRAYVCGLVIAPTIRRYAHSATVPRRLCSLLAALFDWLAEKNAPLSTALQSANIDIENWISFANAQAPVIKLICANCETETPIQWTRHELLIRNCFDDSLRRKTILNNKEINLDGFCLERFRIALSQLTFFKESLQNQHQSLLSSEMIENCCSLLNESNVEKMDEFTWSGLENLLDEPLDVVAERVHLRLRDTPLYVDGNMLIAEFCRRSQWSGRSPLLSLRPTEAALRIQRPEPAQRSLKSIFEAVSREQLRIDETHCSSMCELLRDAAQPSSVPLTAVSDSDDDDDYDKTSDKPSASTLETDTELVVPRIYFANTIEHERFAGVSLNAACRERLCDDEPLAYRRRTAEISAARSAIAPSSARVGTSAQVSASARPSVLNRPFTVELAVAKSDGTGMECATIHNVPACTSGSDLYNMAPKEIQEHCIPSKVSFKLANRDCYLVEKAFRLIPLLDLSYTRKCLERGDVPKFYVIFGSIELDGSASMADAALLDTFRLPRLSVADKHAAKCAGDASTQYDLMLHSVSITLPTRLTTTSTRLPTSIELELDAEVTVCGGQRLVSTDTLPATASSLRSSLDRKAKRKLKRANSSSLATAAPDLRQNVALFLKRPSDVSFAYTAECQAFVSLSVNVCDLPFDARLRLTLRTNTNKQKVACVEIPVFDFQGWLKQGCHLINLPTSDCEVNLFKETIDYSVSVQATLMSSHPPNLKRIKWFHRLTRFSTNANESVAAPNAVSEDDFDDFTERLARDVVRSASGHQSPTPAQLEQLDSLSKADCLYLPTPNEIELLRKFRHLCQFAPGLLLLIARYAIDYVDTDQVKSFHESLNTWPPVSPANAIHLLSATYTDPVLRAFAVKSLHEADLTDAELARLIPSLLEALRAEPYFESTLELYLLERSAFSPLIVGTSLFWRIRVELFAESEKRRQPAQAKRVIKSPVEQRLHFALLLERLVAACGPFLAKQWRDQVVVMTELRRVNESVRRYAYGERRQSAFEEALKLSLTLWPRTFRLPFDPSMVLGQADVVVSRCLDSHQMPLLLIFPLMGSADGTVYDSLTMTNDNDDDPETVSLIFKIGDDLRQDELSLHLLHIMRDEWRKEGKDVRLVLYHVLATGPVAGIIECVTGAQTLAKIQVKYGGGTLGALRERPLKEYLLDHNKDEEQWHAVLENFTFSLAAYSVATYMLGVGDRHNDNIMLSYRGVMFHIDFGHFLGNFMKWHGVKRERALFSLTPEMAFVFGGSNSNEFEHFVNECVEDFIVIRSHAPTLIAILNSLLPAGLRELKSNNDILFVRQAANCGEDNRRWKSDDEARTFFRKTVFDALGTLTTRLLNLTHLVAHSKSVKEK